MICLLVLLFLSTQVWAQPVEGPWEIAASANEITSPEVCVRGSNADVLFIENDSVRYARFSLVTHQLIAGPTAVFALRGWMTQRLHDLIALDDSTWACLVSEDDWGAPGENNIHHRVDLLHGGDWTSSGHPLDSSITHNNFPVDGEYWDEGFSLVPRIGGGVVAGWIVATFRYFDVSVTFRVGVFDSTFEEQFHVVEGSGIWNPENNRALARCVTSDSIVTVTSMAPLCAVTAGDEYAHCYWQTDCEYASALELGRTRAGDLRVLVCPEEFNCSPQTLSVEVTGEVSSHCELLGTLDLPSGAYAMYWHPDFGFAALHASPYSLQLARVDTNGIQTLPTGTMFWRNDNHTFTEANATISDAGQVVAIWTETQDGDTSARRLMLGTVGWDTPLSAIPDPERTAVRRYELKAYPNPFNSTLEIRYALPRAGKVEVAVFNLLGQKVAALENGMQSVGTHNVTWTADGGSGIYFVTLKANDEMRTEKVLLAR